MIKIGVTHTMGAEHKFAMYTEWLKRAGIPVEPVTLSYTLDNAGAVDGCDGIILTGGHDVHPSVYTASPREESVPGTDLRRDDFECAVFDRALSRRQPILGICRALQLVNARLGGTMIRDIPTAGFPRHDSEEKEFRHPIIVEPGSALAKIVGTETGFVNSSHHQAADQPARRLKVTARSADGIIEAMEWNDRSVALPFFLLVQYHPERMSDRENPFSDKLLTAFLHILQMTQHSSHTTVGRHS